MKDEVVRSLRAHYYTDPDIYVRETRGLFARTWQFAGQSSRLKEPGDYFTFEIAGESLFSVMGRDGAIRTFYNVCQHRAHQLLEGEGKTRVIVCPYHAWTYELTGELRSGPNIGSVPGFDRSDICLTEVRTELFLGFVFVNLDMQAEPMDCWYPGVREGLEAFVPHHPELEPVEWVKVEERCNWKVSVENYSECYHCSLNHPTFSMGVVKPETYDIQPHGYCLRHRTECQNLDRMTYPIDARMPHADEYSSWFLWPLFSFQVYPGNLLNTYHWQPMGVDRVVVWRGWYARNRHELTVVKDLAVQDRETTVEEDIRLVESVQRGLSSRGYVPGPLVLDPCCGVNSEHSIQAIQSWMREAVNG